MESISDRTPGLYSRRSSTPIQLPSSHPSQSQFEAYGRAADYIKHMNKIYYNSKQYDSARELQTRFQEEIPRPSSVFKPSYFPRTSISNELLTRMKEHRYTQGNSKSRPRTSNSIIQKRREIASKKEILGLHLQGLVAKLTKEQRPSRMKTRRRSKARVSSFISQMDTNAINAPKIDMAGAIIVNSIKSKPTIKIPIVKLN